MSKTSLKSSLFDEKSLGALLQVYERAFPAPLPAKAVGGWCGLFVFICLTFTWYLSGLEHIKIQDALSLIVSFSLTVCSALMGVVIAGMSIFAASLKPKVVNALIETEYPCAGLSSLKFIFAMFAYLLYSLFLVIVTSGIYYLSLAQDSLLLQVFREISQDRVGAGFQNLILISYASFLIGLLIFLGSILKSFIWNLHQVLLVVAVFNGHQTDQRE